MPPAEAKLKFRLASPEIAERIVNAGIVLDPGRDVRVYVIPGDLLPLYGMRLHPSNPAFPTANARIAWAGFRVILDACDDEGNRYLEFVPRAT